jgi:spore coat protein U-like protein
MRAKRILRRLAAAMLLLPIALSARAAPVAPATQATGSAVIAKPLAITRVGDLDFGYLTAAGAGTATMNPNTGALTVGGGVQRIGGAPTPAHFQIASSATALLIIHIPTAAVTLTRVSGTETMTVTNWTMDGAAIQIMPTSGVLDIQVGGRLNVGANQKEGTYVGTLTVTVDYL